LGFERTGKIQTIWQVEIDAYCRRVLAKHWPTVQRFADIRECCGHSAENSRWRYHSEFCDKKYRLPYADILCGGFPCQDISNAGKRAGIGGERSGLWSEYARIIRELRPRYVVVENVAALLARQHGQSGMERVLGDLAACGYDAEWDCIPAGAFGAHFLRDRVIIIAYRPESGFSRSQGSRPRPTRTWSEQQFERLLRDHLEHAIPAGRNGRISDGVPARVDRLRGLGNAIVPQIAEYIGWQIWKFEVRSLKLDPLEPPTSNLQPPVSA
jgi:DNA (cytosine-5)-methyltransferase 1